MAAQDARSDGADASLALKNEGNAALARGRYAEAISCYSRALEADPGGADAVSKLPGRFPRGRGLREERGLGCPEQRSDVALRDRRAARPGEAEAAGGPRRHLRARVARRVPAAPRRGRPPATPKRPPRSGGACRSSRRSSPVSYTHLTLPTKA